MEMEDRLAIVLNLELQIALLNEMKDSFESLSKDIEKIIGLAENAESVATN